MLLLDAILNVDRKPYFVEFFSRDSGSCVNCAGCSRLRAAVLHRCCIKEYNSAPYLKHY